ncbi:chorismate mutase [Buchnera aphidicola]|uniref:Bifunctional chorismate mutase/prephenate dehydratase n=1 Tax=Buchnera aphidicola subsp. Acyrthosiphon pisum (strain 5A) TaxID=563178 RepID=A0A7U4DIH2_BUCA5|nr:chorismate mutase [Buchnera aphidicola]ACL30746.1 chorismate mutase [Buchnera aphidicola str. 5A (Acyrthosiphon pisum)]OQX98451.1 MAG: bifunctional chorismate mutase/prephenate dehydratase [Erwiniaceae bacterium 4572_131]
MPANNSLLIFRDEINNIDKKIVKLLAERKNLVFKIAQSKIENNQAIRDIEREKKMLQKLIFLGKKYNLKSEYITQLFQLIIEESVATQKKLLKKFCNHNKLIPANFSFLGPKGSYSHIAAYKYADLNFQKCITNECSTFEEVVLSVENNQSDYAVLPIENTCSGSINEVFDILKKTNLFIIGEINIFINHNLLTLKKIELNKIKTIYSHPQPFQQCSDFIKKFPKWKIKYTKSTADAMKKIKKYNDVTNAALGSEIGSKIYGLEILMKNLANKENNITRFILLNRNPKKISKNIPTTTTLIFTTGQEAGSLSKVLSILQEKKLIMKKLTSQKIYKNPWEEMFYIDIQVNLSSTLMQDALEKIKKITRFIKILGCYPSEKITPIAP